jgi:hypothetical protein
MTTIVYANNNESPAAQPGCDHETAKQCVGLALEAMGGREPLQQLKSLRLKTFGHTLLMEQSYRQAPFITSYERGQITLDLANQRVLSEATVTWPEAEANQSDSDFTFVVDPEAVSAARKTATPLVAGVSWMPPGKCWRSDRSGFCSPHRVPQTYTLKHR